MAYVEEIEYAIGENYFAARAAMFVEDGGESLACNNFFAGVHAGISFAAVRPSLWLWLLGEGRRLIRRS